MTEKRFVGLFQGDMLVSVKDTQTNNRVNIIQIIAIANELNNENEQLKKELYNITIDYYTETYFDNSVRRDEHIKDFKEEFKAKYGDVE